MMSLVGCNGCFLNSELILIGRDGEIDVELCACVCDGVSKSEPTEWVHCKR